MHARGNCAPLRAAGCGSQSEWVADAPWWARARQAMTAASSR